jgi:uncharacterized RDD family membrane protein YckC
MRHGYIDSMTHPKDELVFDPHEPKRALELAGVQLASFGRRAAAYLLDIAAVGGTYAPAMSALHYLLFDRLGWREEIYQSAHVKVRFEFEMLTHTAWALWLVLYFGLFVWRTNGYTPGKWLLRIRVASLLHEKITLWQAAERALGYGASALEGGFGFVQCLFTPNHTCTHDRIAETIVIRLGGLAKTD